METHQSTRSRADIFTGLVLGAAVGDALGLPAEGMKAGRISRRWRGPLEHRFLFGRGMFSDDTEHLFMTGQALLEARDDPEQFQSVLARRLRWWLLRLPAGVGLATALAILKLWAGWKPGTNGVWSAGNGPAMRSGLIGARFADDPASLTTWVTASTLLTHRDPRALTGALAIAQATAALVRTEPLDQPALWSVWTALSDDTEWQAILHQMRQSLDAQTTVGTFARALTGGRQEVSGYIYSTVPVALYAWLRHRGCFESTITGVVRCGGDTDTVAAIAGALAGTEVGAQGVPDRWISHLWDWPLTVSRLRQLATRLSCPSSPPKPLRFPGVGTLPRNLLFLTVVLAHGFRRLVPPY